MRSLIVAPLTLRKGGGALGFNIFDVDTERLPVAVEGALEGVLLRTYGGGDRRSAVVPCIRQLEMFVGISAIVDLVGERSPVGCIGKDVRAFGCAVTIPSLDSLHDAEQESKH